METTPRALLEDEEFKLDVIRQKELDLGLLKRLSFYKCNQTEINFRLKNHQEYFITGKVVDLNESPETSQFLVVIKLKNEEKAIFSSWEIDSETIIPSSYNPIRYFIRIPISEEVKNKVFKRDNYECQINLEGCTKKGVEIDHIIPISKGGLNNEENLQSACSTCNKKKNNNLLF